LGLIIKQEYKILNKVLNDIEFKILINNKNCWIKIIPCKRKSKPSSLHIIINNEQYNFNIYDKDGIESDKIYFKGSEITPSFYLKYQEQSFRIDFKTDKINILPINESHVMEMYIKNYCSFISPQSSCWAVTKYYTSIPEKPPFNDM